jgi:hypothetical protein
MLVVIAVGDVSLCHHDAPELAHCLLVYESINADLSFFEGLIGFFFFFVARNRGFGDGVVLYICEKSI